MAVMAAKSHGLSVVADLPSGEQFGQCLIV